MSSSTPAELIRGFVRETFFADQFEDHDSFLQTGIIDSSGMLELIVFIEERFGLTIEESELVPANLDSVANVVAFVQRKLTLPKTA